MLHKMVIKSTKNSYTLNFPIGPNQHKYHILFQKKSPTQDFNRKTLGGIGKMDSRSTFWRECHYIETKICQTPFDRFNSVHRGGIYQFSIWWIHCK